MVGPLQGSAHPRAPQGHQPCCHSPPGKEGDHFNLSRITTTSQPFLIFVTLFVTVNISLNIFFCFTSVFFSPESLLHLSLIWPVASLILKIWLLSFLLFYISVFLLLLKCGDCFCEVCLWPRGSSKFDC